MPERRPAAELDSRYSSEDATPTAWDDARKELESAQVYWLATVRDDGRPHVTPIAAVWLDDALHFTTGEGEQKAKNLRDSTGCVVTTGSNRMEGLDVVVEGEAVPVTDEATLRRLAAAYIPKYGQLFVHEVRDGVLRAEGAEGDVLAYRVEPSKVFAFEKGDTFGQTRWRFDAGASPT